MTKERFQELQQERAKTRYANYTFDKTYFDEWRGEGCFFARYVKPGRVLFIYATLSDTDIRVTLYNEDCEEI